jgi:hypothetical protein
MKTYQAENGETLIAQDEVQQAAFENAGLKPVEDKPKRQPKE